MRIGIEVSHQQWIDPSGKGLGSLKHEIRGSIFDTHFFIDTNFYDMYYVILFSIESVF
jgi:hypothetical protein